MRIPQLDISPTINPDGVIDIIGVSIYYALLAAEEMTPQVGLLKKFLPSPSPFPSPQWGEGIYWKNFL